MSKGIKIIDEVKLKGDSLEIDWHGDILKHYKEGDQEVIEAFKKVGVALFDLIFLIDSKE